MSASVGPKMTGAALICFLAAGLGGAAKAGEGRCWIDKGAVVVAAAYGTITGDFILDLSQANSQLHETAAKTAGWTGAATRWPLRLAGLTQRDFPMKVADLDARETGFPTNIAGILGADAFGPVTLDLDLSPCRLRLSRGPRPRRRGLHRLETRMIDGVLAVFAAISDGKTARTGWFAIDTASAGSRIVDAEFSRPLPKDVDPGGRSLPPARLRAVSIGGVLLEQTPAGLMTPVSPDVAGALGLAVWSRGHMRLEMGGKRLDVSSPAGAFH